jgi:hypothetical protein
VTERAHRKWVTPVLGHLCEKEGSEHEVYSLSKTASRMFSHLTLAAQSLGHIYCYCQSCYGQPSGPLVIGNIHRSPSETARVPLKDWLRVCHTHGHGDGQWPVFFHRLALCGTHPPKTGVLSYLEKPGETP